MAPLVLLRLLTISALSLAGVARAQLPPVPVPARNPLTEAKALLGKVLFWDEQLSSTRTVSCGTCHLPALGGSDPRSVVGTAAATHPGPDAVFGTDDDVIGSPGVPLSLADGSYVPSPDFDLNVQVTGRKTSSMIDAAFAAVLFWDGRAGDQLIDPLTSAMVLESDAALEVQALGPLLSTVEMGHVGRDWQDVVEGLASAEPLALVVSMPVALAEWTAGRSYPELFAEAFGSPDITPSVVAMAIASYQRTLISEIPFDAFRTGDEEALTALERQGREVFLENGCHFCHRGARLTNDTFHYIGVRPAGEDPGRFAVTGNPQDLGRMKTPSLRNVGLRGPYFHNGRFATLRDVVEFYNRGGDFDAPNKNPNIFGMGLSEAEKDALVAFLGRPLIDPRVAAELPPFDRPVMYSESERQPVLFGTASPGSGGIDPRAVALEPPRQGNPSLTIALDDALGGAPAFLFVDTVPAPEGIPILGIEAWLGLSPALHSVPAGATAGFGAGFGSSSLSFDLPGKLPIGLEFFAQWVVLDAGVASGLAASPGIQLTIF